MQISHCVHSEMSEEGAIWVCFENRRQKTGCGIEHEVFVLSFLELRKGVRPKFRSFFRLTKCRGLLSMSHTWPLQIEFSGVVDPWANNGVTVLDYQKIENGLWNSWAVSFVESSNENALIQMKREIDENQWMMATKNTVVGPTLSWSSLKAEALNNPLTSEEAARLMVIPRPGGTTISGEAHFLS